MTLYGVVRLSHLLAMAVWLSAGLLAPRDVSESLERGAASCVPLMGRLRRTARVMNLAAWGTVASGLGLVLLGRGWATPASVWWGLALTLLAILVGRVAIRPSVQAIVAVQPLLDGLSAPERRRIAHRFTLGVRAEDLLRLAVLVLMAR